MCGIFGTTNYYSRNSIERKLSLMSHRGPDNTSYIKVNNYITLGHTRLSIIDLDSNANQPFSYDHISIVFNGEIYNYLELKAELKTLGFSFKTDSDTEVICALFMKYGESCVSYLNGMFAFVIYNQRDNTLFGARDRLGKKPLYYSDYNSSFEFASISNVIATDQSFKMSSFGVSQYLLWGYIPEPNSIYTNIKKLFAGHCFLYDINKSKLQIKKYWELPAFRPTHFNVSECLEKVDNILNNAVDIRLRSDVPLGINLSSGIDSSLITSIAVQKKPEIKTFTVKFQEADFNESTAAKQISRYLGTDHTEIECSSKEILPYIINFNSYYDEPFSDPSALPSLILARETKKHVTVALSGDGGDENFLGYKSYIDLYRKRRIYNIPFIVRFLFSHLISFIPGYRFDLIGKALRLKSIGHYHLAYFTGVNQDWLNGVHSQNDLLIPIEKGAGLMKSAGNFDTRTYLAGDINTKVDRASMAFSLETRAPLMDYRLFELTQNIAPQILNNGKEGKILLRLLLEKYLPLELISCKKHGFSVPIGLWFRNELKSYVMDTMNNNIGNIPQINKTVFMRLVADHMSGTWNHAPKIFRALNLINWMKSHNQ